MGLGGKMGQLKREALFNLLLLASFALLGFSPSTPWRIDIPKVEKTFWVGQSGGFTLHWTTSDIVAYATGQMREVLFSARSLSQKGLRDMLAEMKEADHKKNPLAIYERDFTLLSVVGSMVSFKDHYYVSFRHEAHPAGETRFTTIDLAKPGEVAYKTHNFDVNLARPGKVVQLTDFFPEADVLIALLADPLVSEALQHSGNPNPPRTLRELIEAFSSGASGSEKYCYSVSSDLLTRFAFHHLEKGKVAVRVGLSGAGPCREFLTQLGILLPIPESMRTPLALADAGKGGFLMKSQQQNAQSRKTLFRFATRKDDGH